MPEPLFKRQEEWKKELEKKSPSDAPKELIKERARAIQIKEKNIENPSRFIKDLNNIINYVNKMDDPKRKGLLDDLRRFSEELIPEARKALKEKKNIPLPTHLQSDIIQRASNLMDSGELIGLISELFKGNYRRASISDLIRKLAKSFSSLI